MPAENIPADAKKLFEEGIDCDVVPVSARRGRNIGKLLGAIAALLPEGEPLFPENVLSDKSEKFMIAEIMREKILLQYDKEIPHGVAVLVNKFQKREEGDIYDVDLDIICEKANHKAIPDRQAGEGAQRDALLARPQGDGVLFGEQGVSDRLRQGQGRLAGQGKSFEGIRLRRRGRAVISLCEKRRRIKTISYDKKDAG